MQCNKCGSNKLMKIGKSATFLIMWLFASFFMFVGFIFPPLWLLSAILLFGSPVAFFIRPTYICKDCNYKTKENKP